MDDPGTGLTKVCVLGGVVDGVVVIPHEAAALGVGVVVVLVLAWLCDVLGPAVEGSARVGAVEVDRVCALGAVDEAHHSLGAPLLDKGRARRDGIIAGELGLLLARIDLLLVVLDLDLVVAHLFAGDGVGYGAIGPAVC